MGRKKPQPVVMRKEDTGRVVIDVNRMKVPYGHTAHVTGTGVHADKRNRRCRTRGALRRRSVADSSGSQ